MDQQQAQGAPSGSFAQNVANNAAQPPMAAAAPVDPNANPMAGIPLLAPPLIPPQFLSQMYGVAASPSNPATLFSPHGIMAHPSLIGIPPNMLAPPPAPQPAPPPQAAAARTAVEQFGMATTPGVILPGMASVMGAEAVAGGFDGSAAAAAAQPRAPAAPAPPAPAPTAPVAPKRAPPPAAQAASVVAPSSSTNLPSSKAPAHISPAAIGPPGIVPLAPAPANTASSGAAAATTAGSTMLGGVPVPALPPNSTTAMQVQVAAAAAAAAAAPLKGGQGGAKGKNAMSRGGKGGIAGGGGGDGVELSAEEKARQNRDRNREHARSTRLRKKAYVNKLKELVEGLHAERTEEVRKRRVAIQHLAEVQGVRRAVVRSFLRFHSSFESDPRKWSTLLEDQFWFKQPVTPYRSFRRAEIEQECRMSRGVESMIADAASMSVMVEGIGSRSARWMQIKRDDFLIREESKSGQHMPHSIVRQNSRLQHAVSSLSSSSGSSTGNGSGGEEERQQAQRQQQQAQQGGPRKSSSGDKKLQGSAAAGNGDGTNKVSYSSSSSDSQTKLPQPSSNDFHDYHAPSLPDPMLDSGGSSPGSDSPTDRAISGTKHVCTDSSSGDEDKPAKASAAKKRRITSAPSSSAGAVAMVPPSHPAAGGVLSTSISNGKAPGTTTVQRSGLPPNIAKSGGIAHNIRPVVGSQRHNARLSVAPAIPLPPFVGIGKRAPIPAGAGATTTVGAAIVNKTNAAAVARGGVGAVSGSNPLAASASTTKPGASVLSQINKSSSSVASSAPAIIPSRDASSSKGIAAATGGGNNGSAGAAGLSVVSSGGAALVAADNDTASSQSSSNNQLPQIQAYYHVNEDDMLLTDDVLMCPFVFRSQDAVLCGALAECIMPGMLRAHFSSRNKLLDLEMVYDAMGFMQQLERASGSEGIAQIVPNSLEMALSPNTSEARVITLAKPPFLIVSVNEAWTRTTKYTQMEVEGKEMGILHGKRTDAEGGVRQNKPVHNFEDVARGRCACSVNVHYDKHGRDFVDFVCSYPLTNANDDVTHILHVCKELPVPTTPDHELQDVPSGSVSFVDQ